ncbi:hypothetical protein PRZ48_011051 [Zasmidium cellare]|uniref:Uncharacterized protein n=1 Tax=Zasmidium cellare TaxID=395010 RepID=A0ABR0EAC5_ZASCE|nr:hypothetical protein PRZ48_011051 [Zasmidium cellare]
MSNAVLGILSIMLRAMWIRCQLNNRRVEVAGRSGRSLFGAMESANRSSRASKLIFICTPRILSCAKRAFEHQQQVIGVSRYKRREMTNTNSQQDNDDLRNDKAKEPNGGTSNQSVPMCWDWEASDLWDWEASDPRLSKLANDFFDDAWSVTPHDEALDGQEDAESGDDDICAPCGAPKPPQSSDQPAAPTDCTSRTFVPPKKTKSKPA